MRDKPSVVLVHGGFVDGSGWQGVYDLLAADGYRVSIVQHPTLSLEGDAAATRMILDRQDGPTILVGHSYGGAVISEAGTHERVAGLAAHRRREVLHHHRVGVQRGERVAVGFGPLAQQQPLGAQLVEPRCGRGR